MLSEVLDDYAGHLFPGCSAIQLLAFLNRLDQLFVYPNAKTRQYNFVH